MLIKIILGATLIISFFLATKIIKTYQIQQENELMQSYMISMQKFYQHMQNKIEAVKKYRHDLANHIQTLEILLDSNSNTSDGITKSDDFCHSLINCILLIKKQLCEQKGIFLSIQTNNPSSCDIEEIDLACLLYNLLDNAIEAQERIKENEEKGIWFKMEQTDGSLSIYIKNRIRKGENLSFQTQKSNPEEHGIGTTIIKEIIEKYAGTIDVSVHTESGILEETIVFPFE